MSGLSVKHSSDNFPKNAGKQCGRFSTHPANRHPALHPQMSAYEHTTALIVATTTTVANPASTPLWP